MLDILIFCTARVDVTSKLNKRGFYSSLIFGNNASPVERMYHSSWYIRIIIIIIIIIIIMIGFTLDPKKDCSLLQAIVYLLIQPIISTHMVKRKDLVGNHSMKIPIVFI